jgi:hypothetical protein
MTPGPALTERIVSLGIELHRALGPDLLEIEATKQHSPLHEAPARTYLRLSGCKLALPVSFNTPMLTHGQKRFIG